MIATTYPIQRAADSETAKALTIIDFGNGAIKALIRLANSQEWIKVTFPSALANLSEPSGECFSVGDNLYLVGEDSDRATCIRTGATARGKIDNALPLLMAALRRAFPQQLELTTDVIFTAPSVKQYGGLIAGALGGTHRVTVPGSEELLTDDFTQSVTIGKVSAQLEGYRAVELAKAEMKGDKAVLFDIGNRTIIATVFKSNGKILNRKVFDECGVWGLASRIQAAESLANVEGLKLTPSEQNIIEFLFSSKGKKAKAKYQPQLEACLMDAVNFAVESEGSAEIFLLGGGADIAGVEAIFPKSHKPKRIADPQWASVNGLKLIADSLIARVQ